MFAWASSFSQVKTIQTMTDVVLHMVTVEVPSMESHAKSLGVTGKMQTAGEEKVNSKQDWEDHLGIIDLTGVLVGTIRFTGIVKRTLEKCELNEEEQCLCDDLQSGKHSVLHNTNMVSRGIFNTTTTPPPTSMQIWVLMNTDYGLKNESTPALGHVKTVHLDLQVFQVLEKCKGI